jgi:hypothetical protein
MTVPAHLVQVIRIPEIHCANSEDQSAIPPYRIELVEASERYSSDIESEIAVQYFSYGEAETALKQIYEQTGGVWEMVNGYGNTCLMVSEDEPL